MCAVGCHVHAKNTLDLNYLRLAAQHGAEIFSLHEAQTIEPVPEGYRVRFVSRNVGRHSDWVTAKRVVVAAGTLGTNRLLLRARDFHRTLPGLSPRLGEGFSDNGDFFGAVHGAGDVQPAHGPSVTTLLDFTREGYVVLEGGLPEFLVDRLEQPARWLLAAWHAWRKASRLWGGKPTPPAQARAFDSILPLFLMGRDAADGRLRLGRKGQLRIEWHNRQSRALFRRMQKQVRELGRALDGLTVSSLTWLLRLHLFGVHPLGGCALAESPERGVVNEAGKVFGYPGLFVVDGSIVPAALGVPPSMTIAALAEKIAQEIP